MQHIPISYFKNQSLLRTPSLYTSKFYLIHWDGDSEGEKVILQFSKTTTILIGWLLCNHVFFPLDWHKRPMWCVWHWNHVSFLLFSVCKVTHLLWDFNTVTSVFPFKSWPPQSPNRYLFFYCKTILVEQLENCFHVRIVISFSVSLTNI